MSAGGLLFAIGLAASPATAELAPVREVEIAGPLATLGDLLDLTTVPASLRAKAAALPIADLSASATVELPLARVVERARARMPALAPWLSAPAGRVRVTLVRPATALAGETTTRPCLRAVVPIAAGDFPAWTDFAPAICDKAPGDALVYARASGAVRAARELAVGDTTPLIAEAAFATVRPGQRLYLTTTVGAVRLQREVEAVQPAGAGEMVFVRGRDGAAFPVPLAQVIP